MSLFTKSDLQNKANVLKKSASIILNENYVDFSASKTYDIFLSHSYLDSQQIASLKTILEEDFGYSVYVDWIEDRQLDRTSVTKATAAVLKDRMNNCKCLLVATSDNSSNSKWMPWELGYFDGLKQRVAILPIVDTASNQYIGQEYLGLYPYVSKDRAQGIQGEKLWIEFDPNTYVRFDNWLEGQEPFKRS